MFKDLFVNYSLTEAPSNYKEDSIDLSSVIPPTIRKKETPTYESVFINKTLQPSNEVTNSPLKTSATNRVVRFKGKDINLKDSINIILGNLGKQAKHTCTRAVANALKGQKDYTKSSGVADPSAMYSQLKSDGWRDVDINNYTPQEGDVYVAWGSGLGGKKYDMHTSMYTNEKGFVSYNQDNPKENGQTPWFWNKRNNKGSNVHILRYGKKGLKFQQGGLFVKTRTFESNPEREINLPILDSINLPILNLSQPTDYSYVFSKASLPKEESIIKPKSIKFSGNSKEFFSTMRPYVEKALTNNGIGLEYVDSILAHLSIESAYGAKQSGTNNFGGIKAGKNEDGTILNTHEYRNGKRVAQKSKFKNFASIDDFMESYIERQRDKFLAFSSGPENFLRNMKNNNYFTAPLNQYQVALNSRIKQIQNG